MIRVCPLPRVWGEIYRKLSDICHENSNIPSPPIALILAGWNFSDDFSKKRRWDETVQWAAEFGGTEFISQLIESDFYHVDELHRSDFLDNEWGETSPPAIKPSIEILTELVKKITENWNQIAEIDSKFTKPINFSGAKARSLAVEYDTDELPSWGTWGNEPGGYHKQNFSDKNKFSILREKVNKVIHPHNIDHIVFYKKITGKGR